jgi:mannitol-1-phosphate 5-dehydrogenase
VITRICHNHAEISLIAVTMCRAHRYPPTTKEMADKSRGIGAHTDFGPLTLLLQDEGMFKHPLISQLWTETFRVVGGLEVLHRPTDTWHPVKPIKDAFVVNIGDMMGELTYDESCHKSMSSGYI